jgi:hypothetical protein
LGGQRRGCRRGDDHVGAIADQRFGELGKLLHAATRGAIEIHDVAAFDPTEIAHGCHEGLRERFLDSVAGGEEPDARGTLTLLSCGGCGENGEDEDDGRDSHACSSGWSTIGADVLARAIPSELPRA